MRSTMSVLVLTSLGCRPDLGLPSYPEVDDFQDTGSAFRDGAVPFEPGDERLSLSVFYEGEATETIVVDDVVTHYFIYENTFSQAVSLERIEGLQSDEITLRDLAWWGGGVHWDNPVDLSGWTTLRISLRSSDPVFDVMELGMLGGVEGRVAVADHGFVADGEWHHLAVPLSAFASGGVDLTNITIAVIFASGTASSGAQILVDDLYFSKE